MRDFQFIPGPLHPDLFGDDTPIMLHCNESLTEFSVEVCWPAGDEIECRQHTIAACTFEEAAQHVLSEAQRSTSPRAEVVDVQCLTQDCEFKSWTNPLEASS